MFSDDLCQVDERAPSPEAVVLKSSQEALVPSEEDDAEFARELAKLVTDTSAESRKVDKKTALTMWESTLPPPVVRKKRNEDIDDDADTTSGMNDVPGTMNFTLFTKRGNKQQVLHSFFFDSQSLIKLSRPANSLSLQSQR